MTTDVSIPTTHTSSERIYVGIDIGYRIHVAAALPFSKFDASSHKDAWRRTRTLHFSSDASGFKQLRLYLDKFSVQPEDFLVILEPTGGHYSMALLTFLIDRGYRVLQVENKAVKDYREKIFGSETKTDDVDARLMARMGFLNETVGEEFSIQPVRVSEPGTSVLLLMSTDYIKINKEITRRRNQLEQILAMTFPELKSFFIDGTSRPTPRALLERYPTPKTLASAPVEEVAELLRKNRAYRHAPRAQELVALAQESAGLPEQIHHQWRQGWIIRQLAFLEEARRELREQIERVVANHPYKAILDSLPIRSPIWASALIGVIGDIHRFTNYADFKAYMGWYPRTSQSGSSLNTSGLAFGGVRLTRLTLGQMALTCLSPSVPITPFRQYFDRLVARGMKPATARGHLAGKLAVVIYGMLKTMTPYDEDRHRKALGLPNPAVTDKPIPPESFQTDLEAADSTPPSLDEMSADE